MRVPLRSVFVRHHDFVVDSRGRARRPAHPAKGAAGMAGFVAAAALAAAAPTTGVGEALLAQGRTAVTNAIDLIRSRSPGLRTRAQLTKIKIPYRARPRPIAHARPRPHRPAAVPAPPAAPPPAIPLAFATPELVPASFTPGPFPTYDFSTAAPCPCLLTFVPEMLRGGGLVLGAPLPPGSGGTGLIPPPPGVPEPGPWALMILGFGAAGWGWRRRRRLVLVLSRVPLLFHAPAYAPSR